LRVHSQQHGFDPFHEFDKYLEVGVTTVQLSLGPSLLVPGQGASPPVSQAVRLLIGRLAPFR